MSSNTIGIVVASTSLFSGTSSSLPESIILKASAPPWRGLSVSGWCCYPPAPAACAAFAAGLHSPSSIDGASLHSLWRGVAVLLESLPLSCNTRCGWLSLSSGCSTQSRPCWTSTKILHSHNANRLSVKPLSSFTSQPQGQSVPDRSQGRPVNRACWAQASCTRGWSSCHPQEVRTAVLGCLSSHQPTCRAQPLLSQPFTTGFPKGLLLAAALVVLAALTQQAQEPSETLPCSFHAMVYVRKALNRLHLLQ